LEQKTPKGYRGQSGGKRESMKPEEIKGWLGKTDTREKSLKTKRDRKRALHQTMVNSPLEGKKRGKKRAEMKGKSQIFSITGRNKPRRKTRKKKQKGEEKERDKEGKKGHLIKKPGKKKGIHLLRGESPHRGVPEPRLEQRKKVGGDRRKSARQRNVEPKWSMQRLRKET